MTIRHLLVLTLATVGCLDTTAPPEDGGLGWPGPDADGGDAAPAYRRRRWPIHRPGGSAHSPRLPQCCPAH